MGPPKLVQPRRRKVVRTSRAGCRDGRSGGTRRGYRRWMTGRCWGLPAHGSGWAFEGAAEVGGDPAAVEVTGLGDDEFVVDEALVDVIGVEGEVVGEGGEGGAGAGVGPGGVVGDGLADVDGPVGGEAFELTEAGAARGELEVLHADVGLRDVVDGRVGGFEDTEGAGGVGEGDAAVEDADAGGGGFEARWAGVVPDGFDGEICCGQSGASVARWARMLRG